MKQFVCASVVFYLLLIPASDSASSDAMVQQQQQIQQQRQQQIQQAVQQRQAAQQRAMQQAVQQRQAQQAAMEYAVRTRAVQQQQQRSPDLSSVASRYNPPAADVVDIKDIWKAMQHSSEVWQLMMDQEPKEYTVAEYIDWYRTQAAIIRKSPAHYVKLIDGMAAENPELLQKPFQDVLMFMAILEYDFDNGQNRDDLARSVLRDEKVFKKNKERLGLK